jgi:hypothetical protein
MREKRLMARGRRGRRRRRFLSVLLVLLIVAVGVGIYGYRRFLSPDALRGTITRAIREQTGCDAAMTDVKFQWGRGIVLDGLIVTDPNNESGAPVIDLKNALLKLDWPATLRGNAAMSSVSLNGVNVNAHLDREGHWPVLDRILAKERKGKAGSLPKFVLRDASLAIVPASEGGPVPALSIEGIEVDATPAPGGEGTDVDVRFLAAGYGAWRAVARVLPERRSVHGMMGVTGFEIGPHLRDWAPAEYRDLWDKVDPAGLADLSADFAWNGADTEPLQVTGTAELRAGVAWHPLLPLPLTGIAASVEFDNATVTVPAFTAQFGDADLSGKGRLFRTADGKMQYKAEVRAENVILEPVLAQTLPKEAQEMWMRLEPGGRLGAEFVVESVPGASLDYSGKVDLDGVNVKPDMLPWEIKDLRGSLYVRPGSISAREMINGEFAGGRLETMIAYETATQAFSGVVGVNGASVELTPSAVLPKSMSERIPKEFYDEWVRDAALAGAVDSRISFLAEPGKEIQYEAFVNVPRLQFTHPRLAGPAMVTGNATITPGRASVGAAEVEWAGATIRMEPAVFPLGAEEPWEAALTISNLTLTHALRDILPPRVREAWKVFNDPAGVLDVKAVVRKESGVARLHDHSVISIRDGTAAFEGFPYPLYDVNGHWEIVDGHLTVVAITAVNGRAKIEVSMQTTPYEGMPGRRFVIRGRDAPFDRDFYEALPPSYHDLYKPEELSGRFDLDLVIHFILPQGDQPGWSHFEALVNVPEFNLARDVTTVMRDARIAVEDASAVTDDVRLVGSARLGELTIEGVPLRDVRMEFNSRKEYVELSRFIAGCYDGKLTGTLRVDPRDEWTNLRPFSGSMYLSDARVEQITEDRQANPITGDLSAATTFRGTVGENADFHAIGAMAVRDATIGELPGILSPLNFLVLKKADEPTFNAMELSYVIEGDKLVAEEINFLGSLVSLYGKGTVDKEGKVDFKFIHEFGPRLPKIPILNQLITFIKSNTIPIRVEGAYNDPVLRLNPILSLTRVVQRVFLSLVPQRRLGGEGEKQ